MAPDNERDDKPPHCWDRIGLDLRKVRILRKQSGAKPNRAVSISIRIVLARYLRVSARFDERINPHVLDGDLEIYQPSARILGGSPRGTRRDAATNARSTLR